MEILLEMLLLEILNNAWNPVNSISPVNGGHSMVKRNCAPTTTMCKALLRRETHVLAVYLGRETVSLMVRNDKYISGFANHF